MQTIIRPCQHEIDSFFRELWPGSAGELRPEPEQLGLARPSESLDADDQELLAAARSGPGGAKFSQLYDLGDWEGAGYPSQSEADLALCVILASHTEGDKEKMNRIFENSALHREKWEDREDYRNRTLDKAVASYRMRAKFEPEDFESGTEANKKDESPLSLERTILTARQLANLSVSEKRSYLPPWLNESSIIGGVGWRGVGKSNFFWGCADAVTKGQSFGPWECGESVNCLILDGEMAIQDGQKRIRDFGTVGRKAELFFYSDHYAHSQGHGRANLLDKSWRDLMAEFMKKQDVKIWVCDNIASLAPGIDENSKSDWDPINQWLLELRFAGITTILIHHEGKAGTQRGTSAREDNLDVCISLKRPTGYRPDQGARFIVNFTKSRIPHEHLPLIADFEFQFTKSAGGICEWTWANPKIQKKAEILRLSDLGMGVNETARTLGVDKAHVSRTRSAAIKSGTLNKNGRLTQADFCKRGDSH